jgi:hypothetical protein
MLYLGMWVLVDNRKGYVGFELITCKDETTLENPQTEFGK